MLYIHLIKLYHHQRFITGITELCLLLSQFVEIANFFLIFFLCVHICCVNVFTCELFPRPLLTTEHPCTRTDRVLCVFGNNLFVRGNRPETFVRLFHVSGSAEISRVTLESSRLLQHIKARTKFKTIM